MELLSDWMLLTVPCFKHVIYDVVHKADLRFWYGARHSVKHWHHHWQMIEFLFVSLKITRQTDFYRFESNALKIFFLFCLFLRIRYFSKYSLFKNIKAVNIVCIRIL